MGVVDSLGTAKFNLENDTVNVSEILANPDQYTLLDARSEEERNVSGIAGAITKDTFLEDPKKYPGSVVCYCTVGYISGACTRELRNAGHENVKNMGEGLF